MAFIVPPGGFAGFNQMTPASRAVLSTRGPAARPARRRKAKKAKAARARPGAGRARKGRKMKFGSPAWQRKYKVGRFAKKR